MVGQGCCALPAGTIRCFMAAMSLLVPLVLPCEVCQGSAACGIAGGGSLESAAGGIAAREGRAQPELMDVTWKIAQE